MRATSGDMASSLAALVGVAGGGDEFAAGCIPRVRVSASVSGAAVRSALVSTSSSSDWPMPRVRTLLRAARTGGLNGWPFCSPNARRTICPSGMRTLPEPCTCIEYSAAASLTQTMTCLSGTRAALDLRARVVRHDAIAVDAHAQLLVADVGPGVAEVENERTDAGRAHRLVRAYGNHVASLEAHEDRRALDDIGNAARVEIVEVVGNPVDGVDESLPIAAAAGQQRFVDNP